MASVRPRKISEVKAKLLNPALTSHFHITIGPPSGGGFSSFLSDTGCSYYPNQDRLNLMCCETALPGSQLATTEQLNDFTGVTERHAYRRQFDDRIDLNFYCDAEQYLPIRFFEAWIKYIANEPSSAARKEDFFYRMRFPNKYKGPLEITKFEKNTGQSKAKHRVQPLTYKFVNCFPLAISSMPVTYDASDLLKCNVSFAYSRYYIDTGSSIQDFMNPDAQANYNNVANGFPIGGIPRLPSMRSGNIDPTFGMNDLIRSIQSGLA